MIPGVMDILVYMVDDPHITRQILLPRVESSPSHGGGLFFIHDFGRLMNHSSYS